MRQRALCTRRLARREMPPACYLVSSSTTGPPTAGACPLTGGALALRRLAHHDVSPVSRAPLPDKQLRPNVVVRNMLARARASGALG